MAAKIMLYKLLHDKKMSKVKLSNLTGISRNSLTSIALGYSTMLKLDTIEKICIALECTPNDLIQINKEE